MRYGTEDTVAVIILRAYTSSRSLVMSTTMLVWILRWKTDNQTEQGWFIHRWLGGSCCPVGKTSGGWEVLVSGWNTWPQAKYSPSPGAHRPFLSCFLVSFFSKSYPESWGKGMQEVVASDSRNNEGTQWVVNFFQIPNMGEFDQFSYIWYLLPPYLGSLSWWSVKSTPWGVVRKRNFWQDHLHFGGFDSWNEKTKFV